MSNKRSAQRGGYLEYIEEESWKYYNKNVQYLLEMIGGYFEQNAIGINNQSIIFEKKRGVRYSSMKNLLRRICAKPIREELERIRFINPARISEKEKQDEDALKISDAIAHSVFQCCENNTLGITETRYLRELRKNFACCPEGKIFNVGLKAINYISDINIYPEDANFLQNLSREV